MCDYSLEAVANAKAAKGSKLVSSGFANTISKGFAFKDNPGTAACLLPGAEIAFAKNIVVGGQDTGFNVAKFVKLTPEQKQVLGTSYNDALELPNEERILLNVLDVNQEAVVVQMPADPTALKASKDKGAGVGAQAHELEHAR